jgi:hypothetical protein
VVFLRRGFHVNHGVCVCVVCFFRNLLAIGVVDLRFCLLLGHTQVRRFMVELAYEIYIC